MELRQLVYFDAIVAHGGFTRAAEHLHVAQTAVSAQIRKLERELGVSLLTRTTRRVTLTHAGELVLGRARRILHEIDGIRVDATEVSSVLRGQVRIGAVDAVEPFDLDGALAAFTSRYPDLALRLRTKPTGAELLTALDADDLDLVLAPAPHDLPDTYSAHTLFTEQLVIITAVDHRLTRTASVALTELGDEPFVSFQPGTGLRRILDEAARTAGFTPHVPFETTSLTRMRGLVSNGLGVALVAESVAATAGPAVSIHELHPDPIHRSIALIHSERHTLSPAAQACRELLLRWRRPARTQ